MGKYEKGTIVKGTVCGIEPYGIFVKIDDDYNGLIHISEISTKFVKDPSYFAEIDEPISVQILEIDEANNHMKLSIKNIKYKNTSSKKRTPIIETSLGFKTLSGNLPTWIEENLKKNKNKINSIDKQF